MKNLLPLLALVVCLIGCGANPNAAATQPHAHRESCGCDDLRHARLDDHEPDPGPGSPHGGTANPLYTSVTGNRFFWTKTAGGYPWDIQLYDSRYIYLWVTELDWQNPRTFKVFNSSTLGKFNLPFVLRFAKGDIQVPASKSATLPTNPLRLQFVCHKNLGHVINEVWDPTRNRLVDSFLQTCRRW